jgi:hypothetical protein
MIREAKRHCWRVLIAHIRRQGLMDAAKIIVRHIQAHRGGMAAQLL